ncbi:Lipid phosphate phosphatase-related protein type 4 [Dirofilaria immitis]|nr:Lipid phosphate phosphatase-related protein type 4 [Dirofilaria immitis]
MSLPHSRAQSEIFSASQYDSPIVKGSRIRLNYFIIPIFILSIIGLACLWTLWYYMSFTTVFPYHHRVFQCHDIHLYRPNFLPEDFNLYVSYALLYAFGFTLPPIVILIGEIMFWLFSTKPRKTVYASCGECKIHLLTRRITRFIGVFIFGALITQIFVYTIKFMTGYHRPYFLSLCRPNISVCIAPLEQSPSPSPFLACLYRNPNDLRYASLSFPSLHAAFSSFSCTFASCYIYYMISLRNAPLLRPFLIFAFMGLTLIASFSRIGGYKNHWRDIWCHSVRCFQEYYYYYTVEKPITLEERISPFFQWFRLPRIRAPSLKEECMVYEEDIPQPMLSVPTTTRHRRNQDRTYEVTTTTESFHRTISPPQQQRRNGYDGY